MDYRTMGEAFHCPQCGEHLHMVETRTNDTGRPAFRFKCRIKAHYRTRWHRTAESAYKELETTFGRREDR